MNFEQYLKATNPKLRIMELPNNKDVDVLYYGKNRVCSIPKKGKILPWFEMIAETRDQDNRVTSDGGKHRSLEGVGKELLNKGIVTHEIYERFYTTAEIRRKRLEQEIVNPIIN